MEIVSIFAPDMFAFRFPNESVDEYNKALDEWTDTEYLKKFYEENIKDIENNKYFPVENLQEFVSFISDNADDFDEALTVAVKEGDFLDYFERFYKGVSVYEILAHKKSKYQVLRLYGIQLGNVIIIAGSAIKVTQENADNALTDKQELKLRSLQDFLRDNYITNEESFFEYLSEQE